MLKPRYESFAVAYASGKSATESAVIAGYSPKRAHVTGCELVKNSKVLARINELQQVSTTDKVMGMAERKERLSEIARAKYPDFVECGADGAWINIGPETPNAGAIAEIHSRTEYDDKTSKGMVYTSVKLLDPIRAIAELNKMDGSYAPVKADVNHRGNIEHSYTITVESQAGAQAVERLLLGEVTG